MTQKLPPRTFGRREELVFLGRTVDEQKDYGDKVADAIDVEIDSLINDAYDVARDTLTENRAKLVQIAETLIAKETIEGEELRALFDEPVPPPAEEPASVPEEHNPS